MPHGFHRAIHRNCGKPGSDGGGDRRLPVNPPIVLRVALATPLKRLFDYLPPARSTAAELHPGARVRVPFGRTRRVGLIAAVSDHSEVAPERLRRASELLDARPILPPDLLAMLRWAADYYQYPLGEVVATSLPAALCAPTV